MEFLTTLLAHPAAKGALQGALIAGTIDFQAFRAWKDWNEAAEYKWGTALWRWFQGAVLGALAGFGLSF